MRADDRDRAIERLLEGGKGRDGALRHQGADAACLDAETLAAWTEDALSPAERASAEAHAAGCARCQAALAAMMHAIDAIAADGLSTTDQQLSTSDHQLSTTDQQLSTSDHQPPTSDQRPATSDHRPATTDQRPPTTDHRPPTTRWWPSWLIPITAAAAALVIWIVVPGQRPAQAPADTSAIRAVQVAPAASSSAPAPVRENVPGNELSLDARFRADAPARQAGPADLRDKDKKESFAGQGAAVATGALADVAKQSKDAAPPGDQERKARADERRAFEERGREVDALKPAPQSTVASAPIVAGATPAPAPVPRSARASEPAPVAAPPATEARTQSAVQQPATQQPVTQQAPIQQVPGQQQAQAPVQGGVAGRGGGRAPAKAGETQVPSAMADMLVVSELNSSAVDVISPDPASRWRIFRGTTDRAVQRSTDGGSTWTAQAIDAPASLTAGSAPSRDVCWFVGRRGVVLLTTDGRTWRRATSPAAVDLATIRATDARTAVVTTADGLTFVTTDGGATWRQL